MGAAAAAAVNPLAVIGTAASMGGKILDYRTAQRAQGAQTSAQQQALAFEREREARRQREYDQEQERRRRDDEDYRSRWSEWNQRRNAFAQALGGGSLGGILSSGPR